MRADALQWLICFIGRFSFTYIPLFLVLEFIFIYFSPNLSPSLNVKSLPST